MDFKDGNVAAVIGTLRSVEEKLGIMEDHKTEESLLKTVRDRFPDVDVQFVEEIDDSLESKITSWH